MPLAVTAQKTRTGIAPDLDIRTVVVEAVQRVPERRDPDVLAVACDAVVGVRRHEVRAGAALDLALQVVVGVDRVAAAARRDVLDVVVRRSRSRCARRFRPCRQRHGHRRRCGTSTAACRRAGRRSAGPCPGRRPACRCPPRPSGRRCRRRPTGCRCRRCRAACRCRHRRTCVSLPASADQQVVALGAGEAVVARRRRAARSPCRRRAACRRRSRRAPSRRRSHTWSPSPAAPSLPASARFTNTGVDAVGVGSRVGAGAAGSSRRRRRRR